MLYNITRILAVYGIMFVLGFTVIFFSKIFGAH
jgi:hypothetical protein